MKNGNNVKRFSNYPSGDGVILSVDYGVKRVGLAIFYVNSAPFPIIYGKIDIDKKIFIHSGDSQEFVESNLFDKNILAIQDEIEGVVINEKVEQDVFLLKMLAKIILFEQVTVVVFGNPINSVGDETKMSRRIKNFAFRLRRKLKGRVEICFQDELLTSYEAEFRIKNSPRFNFKNSKDKIDEISALIILEEFLNSGIVKST